MTATPIDSASGTAQDAKATAPGLEIESDETIAGLYRAIALRHFMRYAEARDSAARHGGDFADHPPAPSIVGLIDQYTALVEEHTVSDIETARSAIPAIELAAVIALDKLLTNIADFVMVAPEADAAMQARLLGKVAAWVNHMSMRELADQIRMKSVRETVVAIEKERAKGASLDDAFDAVMARRRSGRAEATQ
ncbi:MAG TPA: hypothetical protein VFA57_08640 [Pseudolabrys sp.]|nr:hypothetical protein [Pseudolabrys sp.]